MSCLVCDRSGWVCAEHPRRPWGGLSTREDACDCGNGVPCDCGEQATDAEVLRAGYCIWFSDGRAADDA